MAQKRIQLPHERIAKSIDVLISKNGSEKTADYLESISVTKPLALDDSNLNLQEFIFSETIKQFRIRPRLFETSEAEAYRKARATCFFLLHTWCKLSTRAIHKKFPKLKRAESYIWYHVDKMKSLESTPAIDKAHHRIYLDINKKIVEYMEGTQNG